MSDLSNVRTLRPTPPERAFPQVDPIAHRVEGLNLYSELVAGLHIDLATILRESLEFRAFSEPSEAYEHLFRRVEECAAYIPRTQKLIHDVIVQSA